MPRTSQSPWIWREAWEEQGCERCCVGGTISHMFVERLLGPTESESQLPLNARYDERLDLNVWAEESASVNADDGLGHSPTNGRSGAVAIARSKGTKADRDKPRMLGAHPGKATRADVDKPRARRLRVWKKTGGDKDKPKARASRYYREKSVSRGSPQGRPMQAGDAGARAVPADARTTDLV